MSSAAVRRLVFGLLLVVVDLRLQGFDVVVDAVGWIVVVGALGQLRHLRVVAVTTAVVQGTGVVLGVVLQLTTGATAPALEGGSAVVWLAIALAVGGFLTTVWVLVTLWRLRTWPLLVAPSDTAVRG